MGKVSREIRTVKRQLMLEEWEKQVIDCRSSGLTVQEWCRQNGVNDKTYYYRLRQVREKCLEARAEKAEKTSEQENIQAVVPLPMKSTYGEIQIEKNGLHISLPSDIAAVLAVIRLSAAASMQSSLPIQSPNPSVTESGLPLTLLKGPIP